MCWGVDALGPWAHLSNSDFSGAAGLSRKPPWFFLQRPWPQNILHFQVDSAGRSLKSLFQSGETPSALLTKSLRKGNRCSPLDWWLINSLLCVLCLALHLLCYELLIKLEQCSSPHFLPRQMEAQWVGHPGLPAGKIRETELELGFLTPESVCCSPWSATPLISL
jgi:hypothetical protein